MRIAGVRARLLLQLLLLLLLLLLLRHRGPVQPDTTRATGQSTEGRGGLLLRMLLRTSSVSIPGELHLLPLLMLRMLLLLLSWFAGRLGISQPGKVLDRSRPAERWRPGELRIHVNEFLEVVRRELLICDGLINAHDYCTFTFRCGDCNAIRGFSLKSPAGFTRDNAPQAIGLVI